MHARCTMFAIGALGALSASALADDPKNLLFLGNSFTASGGGVYAIVEEIAVAAGHPRPHVYGKAIAGFSLAQHTNNAPTVIASQIPVGEHWDHVVLQEYSTLPTFHPIFGNVPAFIEAADTLYMDVLAHSPDAKAVMFETWARGPGHGYYPTEWTDPAAMQAELRENYKLSVDTLNAAHGAGSADYAPVGDAFEDAGFHLGLYSGDIYHASNRGALLISLVLYGTIYDDESTADIDLSGIAASLGLGTIDIAIATHYADRALIPTPPAAVILALGAGAFLRRQR